MDKHSLVNYSKEGNFAKFRQYIDEAEQIVKQKEANSAYNSNLPTLSIHCGYESFDYPGVGHPLTPPISLSTTFKQATPNHPIKFDYSRAGNPNRDILEKRIASLENAKYCTVHSSGLASLDAVLKLLKADDHVIYFEDVYGGTNRYFKRVIKEFKVASEPCDMVQLDKVRAALRPQTRLLWIETPSNPTMRIVDIAAVTAVARAFNPDILVVVDNTFLTPCFQRPLELGADMVSHSLTKYMNGHADVVMGATVTNSESLYKRLQFIQLAAGAVPSPFDCYLVERSLRTLAVRMRQHQLNGLAVALYLEHHPKVSKVFHPGLKSHPQHELAAKQQFGYSGMLSFYLGEADASNMTAEQTEKCQKFFQNLHLYQLAESLGGVESLIEIPSLMTHASVPPDERVKLGISDNFLRISAGIEDPISLIADLDQALEKFSL